MTASQDSTPASGADLVLIDGNSLLYRAYFALPSLTNAQGEETNAAYGFTMMLLKVLEDHQPGFAAVAFDLPGPTFRHSLFEDYKATRPPMPEGLAPQFDMARQILDAMHIPVYQMEGYEADDVIGTLATRAAAEGRRVLIVTGDLDELQLVSDRISVLLTRRGISDTGLYHPEAVHERYGLAPDQLPDFRALRGDASDNIPGVPGVGEKTAAKLIARFGSLDRLLARLDEVSPQRTAAALEAHAEAARRARDLSAIVCDLPIDFDLEALARRAPDPERLATILRRLDFRSLLKRIEPNDPGAQESRPYTLVSTPEAAVSLADEISSARALTLQPLAGDGPAFSTPLLGLAVSGGADPWVVLPEDGDLGALLAPLAPALESAAVAKTAHDLKRVAMLLSRLGISLAGMEFDTMLAAHLINPTRPAEDLSAVASDHLQAEVRMPIEGGTVVPEAAAALVRRIDELRRALSPQLAELGVEPLFRDLEMPLVAVLVEMEQAGVAVDCEVLSRLSLTLGARAAELERDIHAIAGEEFNIGSPVQLRRILFEKLGLPPDKAKRTKSGYSTAADVLAGLAEYEIVAKILEYREVTKLKSTYVDALPPLVSPSDGRLHTTFNQAVTATGRLSSTNPNLQNIPIRTPAGMEIRRAFTAGRAGHLLLSADYSQIELRILAHITGDDNLMAVFRQDEDLHSAAAVEIFSVPPAEVTSQMRAFAKMVNFGIPYGMSGFRLAREMGVSLDEAQRYMERYFARFPKVKQYVEEMPERARDQGYVETLLGRRRPVPELRSRAPNLRQAAERIAINTPMQGSAADIIKLAMLRVRDALRGRGLASRMVLQVHDELLLEVPAPELAEAAALVREAMSGAYQLRVPLKVEVKAGKSWLDMETVA